VYGSPHPERPDRLRAVMARLLASGLAGEPANAPVHVPSSALPSGMLLSFSLWPNPTFARHVPSDDTFEANTPHLQPVQLRLRHASVS
jgi:hypothetical protein